MTTQGALRRKLSPGLLHVRDWRDADKCLLASLLTLPFAGLWIARLLMVRASPEYGSYLNTGFLGPMLIFVYFQALGHLLIVAAGLALRRGSRENPWFIHVTNQFWYVCFFIDMYAIGPYSSPFGMLVVLGAVFGLTVFPRRPVVLGLLSFTVLLIASTAAERLGLIPYAPLIASTPLEYGRPYTSWILSLGLIPIMASALVLGMFSYVIAQWHDREQRLKELSKTDYLTGVENRRSFMERAETEFVRANRFGKPLSVVILDVDNFKRVNDRYGHGIGDEVLKIVARILLNEVRRHDVLARYGGEEFAVLLAETDEEQANIMAERCRRKIEESSFVVGGTAVAVTASIGVAAHPRKTVARIEQLITLADQALYLAKNAGRNRVVIAA